MSEPVQETGFCLPVQRHTYELSRRVRWVALVIRPKTAKYGPFPSTSSVRRAKRWGGSNIDFRNTICFLCVYGCWLCFLGIYYCLDCSSSLRRRRKVPSDYERRTTAWDRQFDEDKCSFEIRHSAAPLPLTKPRERRLTTSSSEQPVETGMFSLFKEETSTKPMNSCSLGCSSFPVRSDK